MGDIKKAFKFLDVVIDFFKSIPRRVKNMGDGFNNIFGGIGSEFVALGMSAELGFNDIKTMLIYIFEFLKTYIQCSIYFITNIRACIFYYLIDAFGQILYIFPRLLLWGLYMFGLDLYPVEKQIWDIMEKIDRFVFKMASFHIIHWPKSVRDKCYNCKRLKMSVLTNKAKEVDYDFKVKIPQIMRRGVDRINKGKRELDSVIK
jgi:hypothetical protein